MAHGSRIAAARRERGLTRAELAKLVDVSRQAVYDWENGKDIKLSNLRKVAKATKKPLAFFVGAAA
jgi:DNA-binding XRE family transcriptional regulator